MDGDTMRRSTPYDAPAGGDDATGDGGAAASGDATTSWRAGVGAVAVASFAPRAGTFAHVALAGNFSYGCEDCAFNVSSAEERDWGAPGVDALAVADVYSGDGFSMIPSISLSLALAIDGLDCADYGDAEAAVFVAALSTVLGSSASTTAGDCTSGRRRRGDHDRDEPGGGRDYGR